MDQLAQREGLKVLRSRSFPDTLAHGAFLRWPPAGAAGWSCTSPTGRMRHLIFHTIGDATLSRKGDQKPEFRVARDPS